MTALPFLPLLQASGGLGAFAPQLFMYGAIFAIFYFILIRPQQKQRREHEELIRNLKKGDEVVTAGGIVGEVLHIKESGESRLIVERGRITRIISGATPPPTA